MDQTPATWRPLSRRNDPDYDTLYEFVPGWLRPSLLDWISAHISYQGPTSWVYDADKLHEIERRLRTEFDWSHGTGNALEQLVNSIKHDKQATFGLDVADLLLSGMDATNYASNAQASFEVLDRALRESGTAWTVAVRNGVGRLEKRVDATVKASAEKVIEESGRAGELLADAWSAVYGRNPNASAGYRDAVRAVEAAAKPVISPNNSMTTLGTIIRDLEAAPSKWAVSLTPAGGIDAMDTLLRMVKLLWKSQFDRHGTPDENVPLNVSNKEAETALHLATTLVHCFAHGSVTRST
jgi:hypothetical protein